ncbi:MAG: type VII secretion protein EccE [Pseudonocardiaceae bacterium]
MVTARARSAGSRVGPLPVVNMVVLEAGLAAALLASNAVVWCAVALIALPLALGRWRGRWLLRWVQLTAGYLVRSASQPAIFADPVADSPPSASAPFVATEPFVDADEPRLALLRLLLPDLRIARGSDHRHEQLGLAWHQGSWTAVLEVDAEPSMITPVGGGPRVPLGALAPCLEHRGVVLDAIQLLWHCYPGNAALPPSSPALSAYQEVLGSLPAVARRNTWVAVRLDPRRCPAAVAERGGGVLGCHRALIGALSRVRGALESRGLSTRPLDADQLVHAGIRAAELSTAADVGGPVALSEGWAAVTAAGVGHASYAISGWGGAGNLTALTGVRALSTTLALTLSPGADGAEVGLRGLARVSARDPGELAAAERRLRAVGQRLGVALRPLHGLQAAGLAATLPLGALR